MNEAGSLIVFIMMVLALLTVIGLASINTASTEIEIAGAELIYQDNFYLAEGAAMEAASWLDGNSFTITSGPSWMEMDQFALGDDEDGIDDYWAGNEVTKAQTSAIDAGASFIAFNRGAPGSSLGAGGTKLYEITVYGRSQNRGLGEVRIGFRKAF